MKSATESSLLEIKDGFADSGDPAVAVGGEEGGGEGWQFNRNFFGLSFGLKNRLRFDSRFPTHILMYKGWPIRDD